MSEAFPLPPEVHTLLQLWRAAKARVVFTNGVYDILHRGHVEYLEEARAFGDRLVVGVNSDASVRRLKGSGRPLVGQRERELMLASLEAVDYVVRFSQDTPLELIRRIQPDVLVKGGDWRSGAIIGNDVVEARGGRVVRVPVLRGFSTTKIARSIRSRRRV